MKELIDQAISDADNLKSSAALETLTGIEGLSSLRVRHLLNNLLGIAPAHYLEIGVLKGATFIPAVSNVEVLSATCIDNWSEFWKTAKEAKSAKAEFLANCERCGTRKFTLIDHDSFSVDLTKIANSVTVYFYDGDHSLDAQRKALTYYYPALHDEFILVVDDWNWLSTRNGTRLGIAESGLHVICEREILTKIPCDWNGWFNGLYIAHLSKTT